MTANIFRGTPWGARLTPEYRIAFVLGGNAKFTVVSGVTGTRFTYHVKYWDAKRPNQGYSVRVLAGADNYTFLGLIAAETGRISWTPKVRIDAPSVIAFAWVWKHLDSDQFEFWHAGTCGRCGRELTDPESIQRGIGPVCSEIG